MKISDKTYILILFIMILGLSLTSYWRFRGFQQTLPEIKLPKIEAPEETKLNWENLLSLETLLPENGESGEDKEWRSADGKLMLVYPGNWLAFDETFSKYFNQAEVVLIKGEVLFLAYRFEMKKQALAFLIVEEIDAQKTLEEIIQETEATVKEQEGEAEITILDREDGVVILEMTSKFSDQPRLHSKGKMFFGDEKTYLVVLSGPQNNWPQFQKEAEEILNSSRLLTLHP